jgi:hypothetical protein
VGRVGFEGEGEEWSIFRGGRGGEYKKSKEKVENIMAQTKKVSGVGSKSQVWHGTKRSTSGGLKKKDLMMTKRGRIVSKKQHAAGKKAIKRLIALGYKAVPGKFVAMRKSMVDGRRKGRKSRKVRGGASGAGIPSLLPSGADKALTDLLKM